MTYRTHAKDNERVEISRDVDGNLAPNSSDTFITTVGEAKKNGDFATHGGTVNVNVRMIDDPECFSAWVKDGNVVKHMYDEADKIVLDEEKQKIIRVDLEGMPFEQAEKEALEKSKAIAKERCLDWRDCTVIAYLTNGEEKREWYKEDGEDRLIVWK